MQALRKHSTQEKVKEDVSMPFSFVQLFLKYKKHSAKWYELPPQLLIIIYFVGLLSFVCKTGLSK